MSPYTPGGSATVAPCGTMTTGRCGAHAGNGSGKPQASAALLNGLANGCRGPHACPSPRALDANSAAQLEPASSRTFGAAMVDAGAANGRRELNAPARTPMEPSVTVSRSTESASVASNT